MGVVEEAEGDVEELFRRHREPMVRLAYLLTGSQAIAEEVTQDAFLQAWPRLGGVEHPSAYLRAIVVNLCRRHHRRADVERRHTPAPPGPALPPDMDETWQVLWRLGAGQRTALVLRFYEDLDVASVARATGCREPAARSLIHRGLATLRTELEGR